jgi:hypothetical protein
MLLSAEDLALLNQGLSVSVASRDARNIPNMVRAVGHRVERSGEVTVFLSRVDGRGVLEDLRDNGAIAVVFSQPSTARTVQLKGTGVAIATASAADFAAVARCREALAADLANAGFSREFALRLLDAPDEYIVAVRFLPRSAFDQTPGPRAGAPLAGDQESRR